MIKSEDFRMPAIMGTGGRILNHQTVNAFFTAVRPAIRRLEAKGMGFYRLEGDRENVIFFMRHSLHLNGDEMMSLQIRNVCLGEILRDDRGWNLYLADVRFEKHLYVHELSLDNIVLNLSAEYHDILEMMK